MSRWRCIQIRSLLGRRGDLDTAEALALEDHLSGCPACRDVAALGDELRRLARDAPASSPSRALERAMRDALSPAAPSPRGRPLWIAGALTASAMTAAVAVYVVGLRGAAPSGSAQDPARSTGDRVIAGEIRYASPPTAPGSIPDGASLVAVGDAVLALGHAEVTLQPSTEIAWHARESTVGLRSGRVDVAVARNVGPFHVRAPRFSVDVTGTRFAVDTEGVQVFEGHVRIRAHDGKALVDSLAAGQSWQLAHAVPASPASPPDAGAPPAAGVAEHLERARRRLGGGDVAGARRAVRAALAADPTRSQRADALTLLAECAVVAGESAPAVRLYLDVADEFGDLAAGETALFSAARVEARRRGPHAGDILRRYLARFPNGQFHAEAAQLLTTLEGR